MKSPKQTHLNLFFGNPSGGLDSAHFFKSMKTKLIYLVLILFAFGYASGSERPNVLFIVSDDHGWGDLPSNWEETEVRLPVLDQLAAQGARFSNYHTVPLCAPSRACMFTGQYSSENGMWRGNKGIKRDVKMLSEYFSEAGYATGCYGKWHMGSNPGGLPNDRGFDEFRGFLSGTHGYWVTKQRNRILHNAKPDDSEGHTTELFTQWSANFIRKSVAQKKPFFCYLAYNAVHGPIRTDESKPASAPKEWVDKALARGVSFLRSDYVAILEHMDHNIGKLVDLIDELNISNNTLVVFVSDNGGCTMEGDFGGRYPGNNGPYRGSKATTYQGGLSVPFLINWKGRVQQGMVSDDQVMHCDVFATLLDAAGIPLPEMNGQNPMRGMSLLPHMKSGGKRPVPERSMIFELWGNIGLRKGNYKLWADVGREFTPDWKALVNKLKNSDLALFDLSKDPSESKNLRKQLPEVYDALKQELIDHFANVNAEYPTKETHPELFAPGKKGSETSKQQAPDRPKSSKAVGMRGGRSKAFAAIDENRDGKATKEELDAWLKNRAAKSPDKFTYNPSQTKGALKKRDKNEDGTLSLEEWINASDTNK